MRRDQDKKTVILSVNNEAGQHWEWETDTVYYWPDSPSYYENLNITLKENKKSFWNVNQDSPTLSSELNLSQKSENIEK